MNDLDVVLETQNQLHIESVKKYRQCISDFFYKNKKITHIEIETRVDKESIKSAIYRVLQDLPQEIRDQLIALNKTEHLLTGKEDSRRYYGGVRKLKMPFIQKNTVKLVEDYKAKN